MVLSLGCSVSLNSATYLYVSGELVKQMVDDVGGEDLDAQIVGHQLFTKKIKRV